MDEAKIAPPRNPSRTLVIALVVVLIVVAIAGIVLASLRGRSASPSPTALSSPTQQGDVASTPALPAIPAEVGSTPNQLGFAKGSDTLSPVALKKISDVALAAKKASSSVVVTAQLEAGSGREQRMEMAKKRADAVRKALQAAGVSVNFIKLQISELPPGLVAPLDADRIELGMK